MNSFQLLIFISLCICVSPTSFPKYSIAPPLTPWANPNALPSTKLNDIQLPRNYNFEEQYPSCKYPIENQGQCGSCWTFGSTNALQARFCKNYLGKLTIPRLSPGYLLECEKENLKCLCGSPPDFAWDFLEKRGTPSLDCIPYTSGDGSVPACPTNCRDGSAIKFFRANSSDHIGHMFENDADRAKAIQLEIFTNGPTDATFNVYADFMDYRAGEVYEHKSGGYEGLHSVTVVGWGESSESVPYWLVRNSWGTSFGEVGYFNIKRGSDECLFESFMWAGRPRMDLK